MPDLRQELESTESSALIHILRQVSCWLSLGVILIGAIAWIGWLLDIAVLQSIIPGLVRIKVNTATGLILSGAALWWWHRHSQEKVISTQLKFRLYASLCSIVVILICVLTLAQFIFNVDLGIDQLLFRDTYTIDAPPGRMSPLSAFCFMLAGIGLLLLNQARLKHHLIQLQAATIFLIAYLGLAGYFFSVSSYQVGSPIGMAIHTAIAFIMLSLGMMFAYPNRGYMSIITSNSVGGVMARRLIPSAIIIPPVLGWLLLNVHVSLSQSPSAALAMLSILVVGIFVIMIGWSARVINRADRRLRQAELAYQLADERLQGEEHLRSVLQNMPVMLVAFDANKKFVVWNLECERVTGFTAAEIVGNPQAFESLHPDPVYLQQVMNQSKEFEGSFRNWEVKTTCKDGSIKTIAWSNVSLEFSVSGWAEWGIGVDVTERKLAEAALLEANQELEDRVAERSIELARANARLQQELAERRQVQQKLQEQAQLLDLAYDPILTRGLDGVITFWNQGAERTYGWTSEAAIGKISYSLLKTQFPRSLAEIEAELLSKDYWMGELTHTKRDGSQIIVVSRWVLQRDSDGSPVKVLEIDNDITERKQVEEKLRLSHERISLANAELGKVAQLKDEFLANMSHELRTPLNAILGLSEALLEEVFGTLTEKQRKSMTTIENSGKHLLALINDILDLSKIESGKMQLEISGVPVRSLCDSSLSFVKQLAHQKQIKLQCRIQDDLKEVQLDERRMRQVLVNLLSNAVKFTPEGGQVELEVRANRILEKLEFSVIDTGVGIAPEDIDKLFRPFVQLDSTLSRRNAGTGLGLSLVRRIAELHGGSVSLESQVGIGSCFTVTIPWQTPRDATPPEPEIALESSNQFQLRQALVVEDSEAAASQVARYLNELGAATVTHPIGEGVVEVALRINPDVIILDVLLPGRSGWEVLAELKANPATQSIPIIVISVVDERSRGVQLGAAAYLLKPFTRQQLQQVLRQTFNQEVLNETATLQPSEQSASLPTILLAEDNEANIATFMTYLETQNLQVVLARNGLEAVLLAKQHQPDLILMDIQMQEMDGLEATRQICANSQLHHIPIIALTALAMPGDRERCLAAGAKEYLTKPVGFKQLIHTISQYLPQ